MKYWSAKQFGLLSKALGWGKEDTCRKSIYRTFLKRQTYIDGELLVVEKDYRSEEGGE